MGMAHLLVNFSQKKGLSPMFSILLNPNFPSEIHENDVKTISNCFEDVAIWGGGGWYHIGTIFARIWHPHNH